MVESPSPLPWNGTVCVQAMDVVAQIVPNSRTRDIMIICFRTELPYPSWEGGRGIYPLAEACYLLTFNHPLKQGRKIVALCLLYSGRE